jgi:hyaluronate lyase
VTKSAGWTTSTYDAGFLGANYFHDGNAGKGTKFVTYSPALTTAGQYQVYARWTQNNNRASNARYDVTTATGTTTVYQNQKTNGGVWVLLGTFDLTTTGASVTVRNNGTDGYVVADGSRFVKV